MFDEYKEEVLSTIRTSVMHGIRKMTLTGSGLLTVKMEDSDRQVKVEEKKLSVPTLGKTSSSLNLRNYSRSNLLDNSSSFSSSSSSSTTPKKTSDKNNNNNNNKTPLHTIRNFQTPARKRVDTPPQFNTPVSKLQDEDARIPSPHTTTKPRVPTPPTRRRHSATIPERPMNLFSKLSSSIPCPCCARRFVPKLFFKARHSIDERKVSLPTRPIGVENDATRESQGSCDHLSPHHFRGRLEEFLLEHGYEGLETDRLMCKRDPELFYNTLWYFHTYDLLMIPLDTDHRENMRIVTQWASPRVLETASSSDDNFISSIVMCLRQKNVIGAVSLLLTARKKAHESMKTKEYDNQMAAAIGTPHASGMSLYTILLLLLIKNNLLIMKQSKDATLRNLKSFSSGKASFKNVHDFDSAYRKALDDLEGACKEDIFALDRNPIANELDTFKILYRGRCRVW